jgi:general secretion pathway protein A
VDEAHNLEWDVLEEIRLLGNLENRVGKLLQIVLSGQQELDAKLEHPRYRQLKQRIALRCALRGFDAAQTAAYIGSRMSHAGVPDQAIITHDLIGEIHFRSQGIPRLINSICDNALLTAFALESRFVTRAILDEVTSDMRLEYPGADASRPESPFRERSIRRQ